MIEILLLAILAVASVQLVLTVVLLVRGHGSGAARGRKADAVKVKDGVRYTKSSDIGGVTHNEGDIVLRVGETLTAKKGGALMPGKYTVLSASGETRFNLRLGGVVREFSHSEGIVLGEGDEIAAVSHTVILR